MIERFKLYRYTDTCSYARTSSNDSVPRRRTSLFCIESQKRLVARYFRRVSFLLVSPRNSIWIRFMPQVVSEFEDGVPFFFLILRIVHMTNICEGIKDTSIYRNVRVWHGKSEGEFYSGIWREVQIVSLTRCWCMGEQDVTTKSQEEIIESRDNCARTRFFSRKAIRKTHAAPLIAEIYIPNGGKQRLIFGRRSMPERSVIKTAECPSLPPRASDPM